MNFGNGVRTCFCWGRRGWIQIPRTVTDIKPNKTDGSETVTAAENE